MTSTIVFLVILNFVLSIILVYSINKLQNSASLTTPASTTAARTTPASTTVARTTPASTTVASTTAARTTPASTTVASTTAARTTPARTTPARTTPASTTTARTTPAFTTAARSTNTEIRINIGLLSVLFVEKAGRFSPNFVATAAKFNTLNAALSASAVDLTSTGVGYHPSDEKWYVYPRRNNVGMHATLTDIKDPDANEPSQKVWIKKVVETATSRTSQGVTFTEIPGKFKYPRFAIASGYFTLSEALQMSVQTGSSTGVGYHNSDGKWWIYSRFQGTTYAQDRTSDITKSDDPNERVWIKPIPEDNFHSTSCASPIDRVTILNKVDEAIIRMRDNQDNITEPLSDAEKAFVMKFETNGFYRNTITTKILREYFTTCRLEYRYTIIIEPNLSGDHPFDEELTQMKINIYDATNAWYKPFIDLGLFPGHDYVDCICVEAVFKKDQQHRLASTEGVYLTDQGDNNSNSFDDNALWWKKKTETFKTFPEYESYIQTKCPEGSFIACRDAHSMQEIVYHTSKYKEKSTAGSIHSENYPDNSSPRYERFFKNAILTRNTLSLFNHEFGHSLFGMRDSLSDYSATYDGRRYYKEDLQSIRPNTTCYGMGRGCLEIGKTDIHCAAICMLGILRHMKSQNGWIDGYMRR